MKKLIATASAFVLKRVLRRKDLSDIVAVFSRVEDDLLKYIANADSEVDALDAQVSKIIDARMAKANSALRAQRILSNVGGLTA